MSFRQNNDGLYCLNDIHKLAGGDSRLRPKAWAETKSASSLLQQGETIVSSVGAKGGTYCSKAAAIKYATWLAPKVGNKPTRNGHVYVIGFSDGTCKIGRSKQPGHRIKSILAFNLTPVVGVWTSDEVDDMAEVERAVHADLSSCRVKSEIFRISFELAVRAVEDRVPVF